MNRRLWCGGGERATQCLLQNCFEGGHNGSCSRGSDIRFVTVILKNRVRNIAE